MSYFCPSQNPSFERVRNDEHDDLPISDIELALNKKHTPIIPEAGTAFHNEGPAEFESCDIERCRPMDEDLVSGEVKSTVYVLLKDIFLTMVEGFLDDILQPVFRNNQ